MSVKQLFQATVVETWYGSPFSRRPGLDMGEISAEVRAEGYFWGVEREGARKVESDGFQNAYTGGALAVGPPCVRHADFEDNLQAAGSSRFVDC